MSPYPSVTDSRSKAEPTVSEICASLRSAPIAAHTSARRAKKPQARVRYYANERLYRAFVSLPVAMCPLNEPLHERIVFFDGPRTNPGGYLEVLLAHVWHVDTVGWREDGVIYNLEPAIVLEEQGLSADPDARLFETNWRGAEDIGYADPARVDLFVAPILRGRLQAVMDRLPRKGGAA